MCALAVHKLYLKLMPQVTGLNSLDLHHLMGQVEKDQSKVLMPVVMRCSEPVLPAGWGRMSRDCQKALSSLIVTSDNCLEPIPDATDSKAAR